MSSLYYRDQGQGPALVLLHSGGMTGAEWQSQLTTLGAHFRLLVPDLPGHGRSPLVAGALSVAGCGRAVVEWLDQLHVERAHLAGSSLGGAVALWLALNHPDRIDKLVLYRVNYRKTEAGHGHTRQLATPEYWHRAGLARWMARAHEPQGGPEAWHKVIARVAASMDPTTTDHAHRLEDLGVIDRPTLLIAGDRDPLAPLDDLVAMYRMLPSAGLWLLPYATHVTAANTWRSESFALELDRFLSGRGVVRS